VFWNKVNVRDMLSFNDLVQSRMVPSVIMPIDLYYICLILLLPFEERLQNFQLI